MCGGNLVVVEGTKICRCDCCQSEVTLSTTNDDKIIEKLNRANHFRQSCEFDRAMQIYEDVLSEVTNDPEVYWNIAICRYGIEYVKDPATSKMVPTCHRTQFSSILKDADYIQAITHADDERKELYIAEAQYIDNVQKNILKISNKEEPFDVFICYKESDENGRRTRDSVLAQELYFGLQKQGFKVFFSRITLESKLGQEYEPYIFAALNSAKVMVVVGTKPEYFKAVWVRNEWSRFLMMLKDDREKMIIPAYKDMDPYDLPDELSGFQAQDMSRIAFMQDLIYGITKIVRPQAGHTETTADAVQEKPVSKPAFNEKQTLDIIDKYIITNNLPAARKVLDDNITNLESYKYWVKAVMIALKDPESSANTDAVVLNGMSELMKCEASQRDTEVTDAVKELMQFAGLNNCTVLHVVAYNHDFEKLTYCIRHNANVNAMTSGNLSPKAMLYRNPVAPSMVDTVKQMDKFLMTSGCSDKTRYSVRKIDPSKIGNNSSQGGSIGGDGTKIGYGITCLVLMFFSFSAAAAGFGGMIWFIILAFICRGCIKSPNQSNASKRIARAARGFAVFFAILSFFVGIGQM